MRWKVSLAAIFVAFTCGLGVGTTTRPAGPDTLPRADQSMGSPLPFRLVGGGRLAGVPYAMARGPSPTLGPEALRWAATVEKMQLDEPTAESLRALAYASALFGRIDQARDRIREALELAPDDPTLLSDEAALALAEAQAPTQGRSRAAALATALESATRAWLHPAARALTTTNYALALEEVKLDEQAKSAWGRLAEYGGPWASEARRRQAFLAERRDTPSSRHGATRRKLLERWSAITTLEAHEVDSLLSEARSLELATGDSLPSALFRCWLRDPSRIEHARGNLAEAEVRLLATQNEEAALFAGQAAQGFSDVGCDVASTHAVVRQLLALFRSLRHPEIEKLLSAIDANTNALDKPLLDGWISAYHGWLAAIRVDLASAEGWYVRASSSFESADALAEAAWVLSSAAWAQAEQGRHRAAWKQALAALASASLSGDPDQIDFARTTAAGVLEQLGARTAAAAFLADALRRSPAGGDALRRVELLWSLAEAAAASGRRADAIKHIVRGRLEANLLGDASLRGHYAALFDWTSGRAEADAFASERWFTSALHKFEDEGSPFLETAVLAARSVSRLQQGRPADAEIDLARGVALFEAQRRQLGASSDSAPFFQQAQGAFDIWVEALVRQGRVAEALGVADYGRARSFLDRLAHDDPTRGPEVRQLAPLAPLPRLTTPVLSLTQLGTQVLVAWQAGDDLTWTAVPVGRGQAAAYLRQFRDQLSDRSTKRIEGEEAIRKLFGPVAERLRGSDSFVAVLDGEWLSLPLPQMLRILEPGRRNARRASIAPSIRSAFLLSRRLKERRGPGETASLVIETVGRDRPSVLPLLAEREVHERGKLLLGPSTTKDMLAAALDRGDVIQLIGHTRPDPADSRDRLTGSDNLARLLSFPSVSSLSLKRRPLVLLTSCSTNSGAILEQEGVRSLAKAFLQAGAAAVVATNSDVADSEVDRWEQGFLGRLATGESWQKALRMVPWPDSLEIHGPALDGSN
jgi:tetratricopeptide (TPR) repeat protein